MKKGIILTLIVIMLFSSISYADTFDEISNELKGVLVGDFESGNIIQYSGNIDEPVEIASITKLMTYLVTKDAIKAGKISLDDVVTVDIDFKNEYSGYKAWSKFYLWKGEKLTLSTLIESMIIPSANDSAIAIAEYVAGGKEEFVKMMNDKAKELGLTSAKFINSNGFPENDIENVMSIRDIFKLARHIIKEYPETLEITNKEYVMRNNEKYFSTNPLLPVMEEVDGLKTGYTKNAGYCLVSTLMVEDEDKPYRLIGVIVGAKSKVARRDLALNLLNYSVKSFDNRIIISKDEVLQTVEFKYGKEINVDVVADNDFFAVVKSDSNIRTEVKINEDYKAPMKKGEKIGTALLYSESDELIGEVDLVVSKDVKKANIFVRLWRWFKGLFVAKSNA